MKKYTPSTVLLASVLLAITYCFLIAYAKAAPAAPPVLELAESPLYQKGEFNLELGAGASIGNAERTKDDIEYGVSVGANYWITRRIGLGIRAQGEDAHGLLIDDVAARLSLRVPYKVVCPYGFFDGIRSLENENWAAGAGGGLEWRPFSGRVGFYLEAGAKVTTKGKGDIYGNGGIRIPLNFKKPF